MKDYQPTSSGGQRADNTLLYVALSVMFAVALLTYAFLNNLVQFVFKSPIVVTGQVLDDDGSPLEQVNVSAHSSRFSLLGRDFSQGADYDRSASEQFKMSCKFCSHLELRFYKQGYYDRRLVVSRSRGSIPAKINNREYCPGVDEPVRTTLVMQKTGTTSELLFGSAVVKTGDDGIEAVLTFDKTERPHEVDADEIDPAGHTPFLFISAAVRSDGDLQIEDTGQSYRPPSSPGQPVPLWHPVDIALVASPAGGGFNSPTITLYQDEFLTPLDIRRRMVTAPSDGYTNRLEIDAWQEGPSFFYFKVDSLYGVGAVYPPVLRRSQWKNVVQVPVKVAVNPDGSRITAAARDENFFVQRRWPTTLPHR